MVQRIQCEECKSFFYTEIDNVDEYVFSGKTLCSYCFDKAFKCDFCDSVIIPKKEYKMVRHVCEDCKRNFNGFSSRWQSLRFKTFIRDNFQCRYCGRSPMSDFTVTLHCDHIIPKSKGGEDALSNLITACHDCNTGKMDVMLREDFILRSQDRLTVDCNCSLKNIELFKRYGVSCKQKIGD
jgi:5-methylcytosine-specific restriction endonuclease McrA